MSTLAVADPNYSDEHPPPIGTRVDVVCINPMCDGAADGDMYFREGLYLNSEIGG
jgi:hypothetical protein